VDDSVGWFVGGSLGLLRRARGYAPLPLRVTRDWPTVLAVGGHLKNTIALATGRQVFLSQHIGDLETPEAMGAFERVIGDFLRLYDAKPVAIAHDLHPDYVSTQWARRAAGAPRQGEARGAGEAVSPDVPAVAPAPPAAMALLRDAAPRLIAVQHHHAHLAACLAEHGVVGRAMGVTWDGTGHGADGTVWGGEFLLGDATGYRRVAHLRPFRLPGGEAAVHEPRRVALALLWELFGRAALSRDDLAAVAAFTAEERAVLGRMLERGLNAPVTTSAGRLFDGVAALIGLHHRVTFEGQAAIALEFAADPDERAAYPVALGGTDPRVVDWGPAVAAVLDDLERGRARGVIAARFHNALVDAMAVVAGQVGEARIALTGGCFQNRRLSESATTRLAAEGHEVLVHRLVPPNDGGISLGQAAVAAARLMRE
jgi:hydrogenase maturation protein HypF